METKKQYLAPELTIVTFRVENGFTISGGGDRKILSNQTPTNDYNDNNQQKWTNGGNLFDGWGN